MTASSIKSSKRKPLAQEVRDLAVTKAREALSEGDSDEAAAILEYGNAVAEWAESVKA